LNPSKPGGLLGPDGEPLESSAFQSHSGATKPRKTPNHLADETSPYLQQHAFNPVDWYPWNDDALDRARTEDKPIFLSIGYAACHWCHVMEHESFENEAIAEYLNEHFICVKVDREERPDLDDIYMNAVQMIAGQGGWPMSVFLTPALKPFFGGTYFPPDDRDGRPGFARLLRGLVEAYTSKRGEIEAGADQVLQGLQTMAVTPPNTGEPTLTNVEGAVQELIDSFDSEHGGFGDAPKFPHSMGLQLLLRHAERSGSGRSREVAIHTLEKMARGGIYDHLAGGFHRYATDAKWLIPHFEKMLYDQALLVLAYTEAVQLTGREEFRKVISETLTYVRREMTSPGGAFFATEDADTEGEEGRFYVWTRREVYELLEEREAELFCRAYDVDEVGNWEGSSILQRVQDASALSARFECSEDEIESRLGVAREILRLAREKRVRPVRDEKILTGWNALMISAFSRAGRALGDAEWIDVAERAAKFVLGTLVVDGRLYRVTKGDRVHVLAYLEDYANWIVALTDLYEATLDEFWLEQAVQFADEMVALFTDADGGFFLTAEHHRHLLVRLKMAQDGSTPSGNSMAAYGLLRLGRLVGRSDLEEAAAQTLRAFQPYLERMPAALHQMMLAVDLKVGARGEVVLAGDRANSEFVAMRELVDRLYLPRAVFAAAPMSGESSYPGLSGKTAGEKEVAAYVCEDFSCAAPVYSAEALGTSLSGSSSES